MRRTLTGLIEECMNFNPGLSQRSNPGLQLANAFGVMRLHFIELRRSIIDCWLTCRAPLPGRSMSAIK